MVNALKNSDDILKALDGCDINVDNYNNLSQLSTYKINNIMSNVLNKLDLYENELQIIKTKLNGYMYVDEIDNITNGSYIRWIPIYSENIDDKIKLSKGGFICDFEISDNGVYIYCKGITNNIFKLKLDNHIIFKKLSDNEKIIIYALDLL
jgi:hypothetical protein